MLDVRVPSIISNSVFILFFDSGNVQNNAKYICCNEEF